MTEPSRGTGTKKLLVLGTVHEAQEQGTVPGSEFVRLVQALVAEYGIRIILEEWTFEPKVSVAATLAGEGLRWRNIGTPDEERFETYDMPLNFHPAKQKENHLYVSQYGPLENQNARELFMVSRIAEEMIGPGLGLVVVGLAHLHSMTERLRIVGFDVTACYWLGRISCRID